ncbi:MAG: glycosyltransferase family 1 protein [Parcubacteria group bacterium]
MKIAVDVRCLMEGRRTGVEEYTLGLLENLFELDKKNEYVLFFNSWKNPNFDFSVFSCFENVSLKRFKVPNKLLNLFFWYFSWPKIDRLCGNADVVFIPNIIFGAVSRRAKLVLTVHDLSFERHSEYFSRKRRWWHMFINTRTICRTADKIIAVSHSTRNDLVNLYGVGKEKIEMIHSAVGSIFMIIDRNDVGLIKTKEKYALPYNFILSLGTIEPRKNIAGTVRAYNALQAYAQKNKREDLLKYELVIAGESGWNAKDIFYEIRHSPFRKKIKMIRSVPSGDKPYLYNLATLFVYPSFFEGFGFPPLEAMSCGVPVITSNNSSLPEITADAAILIDPDRPDELYRAMREILSDNNLRKLLVVKGLEKSKEFTWTAAARKTLRVFDSL